MTRLYRICHYGELFLSAIRRRGIIMTVRIAYHELVFDWKYGTETKEYVEAEDIRTDSLHKQDGHKYGPLQIPFFWRVFGTGGPVLDRNCYVDFGCGKGRTLILAALCGFARVIGVEYSRDLCDQCNHNIEKFRSRAGTSARFEVVHADAADYVIPEDASTLVFYDPFSLAVFRNVVQNIETSLRRAPRPLYIVFFNCSEACKAALSGFEKVVEYPTDKTFVCRSAARQSEVPSRTRPGAGSG